ncbi:AraC family transcriptional regulator [Hymenobacter sp. BT175]|uniref:helix-turn-helix domain-containing protein n=1 Tax=Hymenobacter translucens TaxID=2886507 RepID=UPI001D0E4447|nr:AraC family transcriptional regulator [Hymenobacter translucens]MCC2545294.1 AraC family transcriptional regulator [Hymenobacter translucens]
MLFQFNAFSGLLLPFFVQGVVVAVVLLTRGRRHGTPADGWLALLLLLQAVRLAQWMLGFAGWYDAHNAYSTAMFYFPFSHWLAVGPAFYFYFRSLTNQEFRFERRHWWHFVPALTYVGWRLAAFALDVGWQHGVLGQDFPLHFGTKGWLANLTDDLGAWVEAVGYVSVAVYTWLTLRDYRVYRRYINDNFSDTEQIRFGWLRNLLVAVLVSVGITFCFSAVDVGFMALSYYQVWYEYLLTGILIYFLSIAGLLTNHRLTAPLHFEPEAPSTLAPAAVPGPELPAPAPDLADTAPEPLRIAVVRPDPSELKGTGLAASDPEVQRWVERVTRHMETARPYLAPELTLGELATQLRTNTSALSRVINAGFGVNFNDFINGYRVREAERKLSDPLFAHYTLLAVALESGFNSKSTFNRVFKKLRGITPSAASRPNV